MSFPISSISTKGLSILPLMIANIALNIFIITCPYIRPRGYCLRISEKSEISFPNQSPRYKRQTRSQLLSQPNQPAFINRRTYSREDSSKPLSRVCLVQRSWIIQSGKKQSERRQSIPSKLLLISPQPLSTYRSLIRVQQIGLPWTCPQLIWVPLMELFEY